MTVASGHEILADDILRLDFFPVGTIMMYDGSGWQDNVTLKGWYKCAGQTVSINGTNRTMLDLRDKFLFYENNSTPATMGSRRENKITLTDTTMPFHTHTKNFVASTETPTAHTHTMFLSYRDDGNFSNTNPDSANGMMDTDTGDYAGELSTFSGGGHDHTVSPGVTVNSKGQGQEFSIMPLSYKVIFIKKMI